MLLRKAVTCGRQGLYRTGLEVTKLLLALSPVEDPVSSILMLPHFCFYAGEHSYLRDFIEGFDKSKNLRSLPNFAFARALLDRHEADTGKAVSGVRASTDKLEEALLRFPWVLVPLIEKTGIHVNSTAAGHNWFQAPNPDAMSQSERSVLLLGIIFVERSHGLWADTETAKWINVAVENVVSRLEREPGLGERYETMRREHYGRPPPSICRHVLVLGFKDAARLLPGTESDEDLYSFDPYPPTVPTTYTGRTLQANNRVRRRDVDEGPGVHLDEHVRQQLEQLGIDPRQLADQNMLAQFFNTLVP